MRLSALMVCAFVLVGCVTGPITEGPHRTQDLQDLSGSEGAKLAEIATRNTLANYAAKMAHVWRVWEEGAAEIKAKKPSGELTPEQTVVWASTVAETLLGAAQVRDDKLATLDRKRAREIEQIRKLHANQISAVDGIVEGWRAQGQISSEQYRAWLEVGKLGASMYLEQQHIKRVRKEAEEAARAAAAAEEHSEE